MAEKQALTALFEKYIRKLRITPAWDIRLEFVEDPAWPKTGDIKIDCADRKAVILLNIANPKQEENFEEILVHELMHIKMYPLDQVTESLIANCFAEGSAASNFAYEQFLRRLSRPWRSSLNASCWNSAKTKNSPTEDAVRKCPSTIYMTV